MPPMMPNPGPLFGGSATTPKEDKPRFQRIHPNSRAAHKALDGKIGERQQAVLDTVTRLGEATDRQVMEAMGFSDMNQVRPRITELLAAGELEECGAEKCLATGRTVRIVRRTPQ